MATRQGLILNKSRRRDPLAYDYGVFWLLAETGHIVAGDERVGMSLEEAETWLLHPPAPPPKRSPSVNTVAKKPQKKGKK